MCNCQTEVLERVSNKIKTDILPKNAMPETVVIDWENKAFTSKGLVVGLPVAYEYQREKANGDVYKNKNKGTVSMFMSYCPFCGEKLNKDSE